MWEWLFECKRAGNETNTGVLKIVWLESHGYEQGDIDCDCFFCDYDGSHEGFCSSCPACLVDKNFDCDDAAYSWHNKPIAFYEKLVELHKEYEKAKKRQKK